MSPDENQNPLPNNTPSPSNNFATPAPQTPETPQPALSQPATSPAAPSQTPQTTTPTTAPLPPQPAVVTPTVIQPTAPAQATTDTPPSTSVGSPANDFYQSASAPAAPAQPQVFAGVGGLVEPPAPKKSKLPFIIAGATASVILLVAVGVFGFYLPNTEANVWNTGLTRSGKAFDKVVVEATDAKKIESYKTTNLKGKVTADFKDGSFSGDVNVKFDKANSDGSASFTLKNESEGASSSNTLSGKFMTELPEGSNFPNIYFQYSGLKAMGLDFWLPGAGDYENRWILADAKYLETLGEDYKVGASQDEKQITSADIAEVARVSSQKTTEYVLTSDPEKAVFEKREFIGKERVDEINTYHYKVGINVKHATDYCEALTKAIVDTKAYEKLANADTAKKTEEKNKARKDCEQDVKDSIKSTDTFDLWIDKKYKLIHKARIYDKEDRGTYTDIGQTYKGGDQLSLFIAYHNTKSNSDGKFTLDTNLETNKTSGEFTYSDRSVDSPFNVKVTLESTPSAEPVKINKPVNPMSIQEFIQKMEEASQAQSESFGMDYEVDTSYSTSSSDNAFDNY